MNEKLMNYGNFSQYKSWLLSGGIVIAVALWLIPDRRVSRMNLKYRVLMSAQEQSRQKAPFACELRWPKMFSAR